VTAWRQLLLQQRAHHQQIRRRGHLDIARVTINDNDFASFASDVSTAVSGDRNVRIMDNPVMGAEDFSYVLNRVPGSMMFLGLMPEGMDIMKAAPNHSNRAIYAEDYMRRGTAVYSAMALRHLGVALS
jgi:hippurate hydrolase